MLVTESSYNIPLCYELQKQLKKEPFFTEVFEFFLGTKILNYSSNDFTHWSIGGRKDPREGEFARSREKAPSGLPGALGITPCCQGSVPLEVD